MKSVFRKNDRVYTHAYGWGTVKEISENGIKVEHDDRSNLVFTVLYTYCGRTDFNSINPVLWFNETPVFGEVKREV